MSKAVDKAVEHRDMRVARAKAKTVDVSAWKSHKESWEQKRRDCVEEHYKLEQAYLSYKDKDHSKYANELNEYQRKMKILMNDYAICDRQILICTHQIDIAELIKENTELKTNLMNA